MDETEIQQALSSIEDLAKRMVSTPESDRILIYKKIDRFLLSLEGHLARFLNVNASTQLNELKMHMIVLARLDEPDENSDQQHYEGALESISRMRHELLKSS